MGPETYKGLPSAFVFSNRLRGLGGTVRLVTETTPGWHYHAHCMSRGDIMLSMAIFDMFESLWIEIHSPGWLDEQKTCAGNLINLILPDQVLDPQRSKPYDDNGH